jgi:tetratricopeptide (TPR) repeat protein
VASQPSDPAGDETHFDSGLAELHQYLFHFEEAALPRAVDAFRLATTLAPDKAGHWAALGFALDASDLPGEALAALRRANDVEPEDEEVEVFVLTLLSELGPESEAMAGVEALATRNGVDLESLRRELADAGLPVNALALLRNGFLRARNFLRSTLEDAIERSHRMHDPEESARQAESDRQECFERQEELQDSFDPDRVPAGLHDVIPWAMRLGVGDDVCRSTLVEGLTTDERSSLLSAIRIHASSIDSWLDTFEGKPMAPEAAAFMYLLVGVEETNALPRPVQTENDSQT